MEMNKKLVSAVEETNIRIEWVKTDAIEIYNLIDLLNRSVERDENKAMHIMLDMICEKTAKLINADLHDVNVEFLNVKDIAESLLVEAEKEINKPKQTRKPRTATVNKNNSSGTVKRTRTKKPMDMKTMTEALKIEPEETKVVENNKTE